MSCSRRKQVGKSMGIVVACKEYKVERAKSRENKKPREQESRIKR